MKKLIANFKSVSKPMQRFLGIMIVFFIIVLAKSGFHFGVWLKTIL